jgi:hypothetical protein
LLQQVVWNKFTDISAVFTAPIIRVMTWQRRQQAPLKHRKTTILHDATIQKTANFIPATMRT